MPDLTRAPTGPPPPPVIPDHELLGRISQGSYGEVWLARSAMGTLRAVKIIRRASFQDNRPYDREFNGLKNFEPLSRKHDGLVDILQVGRNDEAGYFYYVMELADDAHAVPGPASGTSPHAAEDKSQTHGATPPASEPHATGAATPAWVGYSPLTLQARIRDSGRLPIPECLAIAVTLADALRFLHDQGLVHRDIKPSNIIFVGGKAKLADVGLVARSDDAHSLVGTEGFIPPEGPGSVRADLYGLGKCLYEMAMGKDRLAFPSPPTQLDDLPQRSELLELNEVITRACEPDPSRRYPSAQAMLSDLEHLQRGDSVREKRTREKRRRAVLRMAALAGACGLAALLFSVAGPKPEHILFEGNFDTAQLDASRWKSNHVDWGTDLAKGTRNHDVSTAGGELVIRAETEDTNGLSCSEGVWVDLREDFRLREPCRLQVTLSGKSYGGALAALISAGGQPVNLKEPSEPRLVDDYDAPLWQTNRTLLRTLRVDLLPTANAAVVWPDTNRLDQFRIEDLRDLPRWHLRFLCGAQTSRGHGTGSAELRIQRVKISAISGPVAIAGQVIEDLSGRPVPDARIRDASGMLLARTTEDGAFCLRRNPRGPLTIEKANYESIRIETGDARRGRPLLVRLPKTVFEPGDVMARIPYGNLDIIGIAFRQATLWACAYDGFDDIRLFPVDPIRPSSAWLTNGVLINTELQAFAQCGERLLGLSHWQGWVHDLAAIPPRPLLELKPPNAPRLISYPKDCAYDGRYLWFTETDVTNSRWFLHALDIATLRIAKSIEGRDDEMPALAWDGTWFWISGRRGLYAIDPDVAHRLETVESGLVRGPYPGRYSRLAFGTGALWGLDAKRHLLCKIKTDR